VLNFKPRSLENQKQEAGRRIYFFIIYITSGQFFDRIYRMASSVKLMFLAIACVLSIKAVDCKSVKVVTWEDEEDPSKTDFLNNLIEAESEENDIQGEGPNSIGFNGGRFPHYHEPNPDIHLTTVREARLPL